MPACGHATAPGQTSTQEEHASLMSVNLVKLCVGIETVEDLVRAQRRRVEKHARAGKAASLFHATRMTPRRREELLDGGSLYWVIKGVIQVRQRIIGLAQAKRTDGTPCCQIMLDKSLHLVRPTRRRPFQGWRYLEADDTPPDLTPGAAGKKAHFPPAMRRELAELGLI